MVEDTIARAARFRVPLGFVFGLLVLWLAQPTARTLTLGGAIACAGEALRIWAAGHLNKSREVTASGPYRWFAHPLYVGSSVMGAGLAVASNNLVAAVPIGIYLIVTIALAIKTEEAFLRRQFGDRYESYRSGTLTSSGRPDGGVERRFGFAQAMANREYRAVIGLVLAIVLLGLKLQR